jgi:hypothetical protein
MTFCASKHLAELSSESGVHPTMISTWKQELMQRASELFAHGNKAAMADVLVSLNIATSRNRHYRIGTKFRRAATRLSSALYFGQKSRNEGSCSYATSSLSSPQRGGPTTMKIAWGFLISFLGHSGDKC